MSRRRRAQGVILPAVAAAAIGGVSEQKIQDFQPCFR